MNREINLAGISCEDGRQFLSSFDYVFTDLDGVLLLAGNPLPGAALCIDNFKQLGKQIAFVTNNTISSLKTIKEELKHFNVSDHEIVTPIVCIITYLKKIQCPKDIYCIGGHVLRDSLTEAGYNIVEIGDKNIEESMSCIKDLCIKFLEESTNVGAVVLDLDINFKLIQAQGAILLLTRNPEMPFICAAKDESGPLTEDIIFIGNQFYVNAIESITKTKCTTLAKPSIRLKAFLEERYDIKEPKRVLFIGDSVTSDIAFANKAGYQSILVLTGQTKLEDLLIWKYGEEDLPNYYVESLEYLSELINKWNIL